MHRLQKNTTTLHYTTKKKVYRRRFQSIGYSIYLLQATTCKPKKHLDINKATLSQLESGRSKPQGAPLSRPSPYKNNHDLMAFRNRWWVKLGPSYSSWHSSRNQWFILAVEVGDRQIHPKPKVMIPLSGIVNQQDWPPTDPWLTICWFGFPF